MKAPRVFIVQGWNYREGSLLAWYFDEQDARSHSNRINGEQGDEWATRVEACESGEPIPEQRW